MKKIIIIAAMLMATMSFAKAKVTAPDAVDNKRILPEFTGIEINTNVTVILLHNDVEYVVVDADENTQNTIQTKVENNVLYISSTSYLEKDNPAKIYVNMKMLESLVLKGDGRVVSQSKFTTDDLNLLVAGTGNVELIVAANNIVSGIEGSGNILLHGLSASHSININGSGNMDAMELITLKTKVNMTVAGNCYLNVSDLLQISKFDDGMVLYKGSPQIVLNKTNGKGKIGAI